MCKIELSGKAGWSEGAVKRINGRISLVLLSCTGVVLENRKDRMECRSGQQDKRKNITGVLLAYTGVIFLEYEAVNQTGGFPVVPKSIKELVDGYLLSAFQQ